MLVGIDIMVLLSALSHYYLHLILFRCTMPPGEDDVYVVF